MYNARYEHYNFWLTQYRQIRQECNLPGHPYLHTITCTQTITYTLWWHTSTPHTCGYSAAKIWPNGWMLYYYMYRHLYCYTLNRSVFIKWEGKVYIITHNYLLHSSYLKDQASCLLSASPSIPATIHIHTYSSYTTKYKCQAHHKSTCMHHMKSVEPCSYLMTTHSLQCPFYLSCCWSFLSCWLYHIDHTAI